MPSTLSLWSDRVWQDLLPTPGRLNSSLRIVLASLLTLLCLLVLQMPFASVSLYFVFLVGRDSPAVSVRSGVFSVLTLTLAVATELAVVILTDNDPMARVLSVAIVSFLAGILMLSTTLTPLASTWGFIFCTLIALWENHVPAGRLVTGSLWVVASVSTAVGCSILVEYIFGPGNPAQKLQQQRLIRYQALFAMFDAFATGAPVDSLRQKVIAVSRLAGAGQEAMQQLYNSIVERNLSTGSLPVATRVRITMLAQLMDVAAAFGTHNLAGLDQETRVRAARIADLCDDLSRCLIPHPATPHTVPQGSVNLIDRVEAILYSIVSMPDQEEANKRKELVALPAGKVPIFIPGAYKDKATVAFALKLSLCATLCYVFYHAVDWPGIGTAVTTVLIAGLSTTGAIKQRLIFRVVGAIIGGLILGLGATAFLFPLMDSIASLSILIGAIAFLSAWWAAGRQFGYIGLQIAFSFYLVAFEGFSAPAELAPARDRLIGILVALVVMAVVFDLIWPVRTVTAMRRNLAFLLRSDAELLRLFDSSDGHRTILDKADGIRDRAGKVLAALRGLNEVVEYDFGVDREAQILISEAILRSAFSASGLFWNQLAFLHDEEDSDFRSRVELMTMRHYIADQTDSMAQAVLQRTHFSLPGSDPAVSPNLTDNPRFAEYTRNTIKQYRELATTVGKLGLEA